MSSPTPSSLYLYRRVYFLFPPPIIAPVCHPRCYRPSPIARHLSPPPSFFSLTRAMFDCCVVSSSYPSPHHEITLPPPSSLPPPPPPPPALIALSTARFRCSQRDDISVAVISATYSSLPNDNVQRRDCNGRRRRNGRQDGGNDSPLSQPPPRVPPVSRAPLSPPT